MPAEGAVWEEGASPVVSALFRPQIDVSTLCTVPEAESTQVTGQSRGAPMWGSQHCDVA